MTHRGVKETGTKWDLCYTTWSTMWIGFGYVDGSNRGQHFFFFFQTGSSIPEEEEDEQSSLEQHYFFC
jgi:hypothetical protein